MTVQALKKKADTFLIEIFQSVFEDIDTTRIRREVDELRRSAPTFDPVDHARTLARRTAVRCAATGAMTGLPSGALEIATLGAKARSWPEFMADAKKLNIEIAAVSADRLDSLVKKLYQTPKPIVEEARKAIK